MTKPRFRWVEMFHVVYRGVSVDIQRTVTDWGYPVHMAMWVWWRVFG